LTAQGTAKLVRDAASRARGGILMLTDAHGYARLQPHDRQALRFLQEALTDFREDLIVVLAGRPPELRTLLLAIPALATRFPVAIDFPGYTTRELTAILITLATEAGFTLTSAAADKASAVLEEANDDAASGTARLAVQLLDQATVSQARRIATALQLQESAELGIIHAADMPGRVRPLLSESAPTDSQRPGQYL
jgi:stage V sporulation protein K